MKKASKTELPLIIRVPLFLNLKRGIFGEKYF